MFNGWLEYAGVEIINAARTKKYIEAFLPTLSVTCDTAGLLSARGHTSYVSPAADSAPWYKSSRAASARFYGLFPGELIGTEDSTRQIGVIELPGDGAAHAKPRYASREIKVTALALAADEEAMGEGLAWVREVLAAGECATSSGCSDNDLRMYVARPANGAPDNHMIRTFIRTEVLDNLKVVKEFASKNLVAKRVTFIFSASPWAFTPKILTGVVDPTAGTSFSDPAGEDCYTTNNAFAGFINDPYYTAVAKPPQPPTIKPPNIIPVSSWRRQTLTVTQSEVDRWGRVTPILTVVAGTGGVTQLRIRFYGAGKTGCNFEGEFLVAYIPPSATMVIDSMRKDISVILSSGKKVPGGHLVYGSGGLPLLWPALNCSATYTMAADILPGQSNINVHLEAAVRE